MITKELTVTNKDNGQRLDMFLSSELGISRSQVQKKIKRGGIWLNGEEPKKTGEKLKDGDLIEVTELPSSDIRENEDKDTETNFATGLDIKVVSETSDYLIIDKPAGLLTHPTEAAEPESLTRWIWENHPKLKEVGEYPNRPGIVHRLDKDASGLLVVAKTQEMFEHLKKQFKNREVKKEYVVLVHGIVESDYDTIDFDIDRGRDGRMAARPKTNRFSLRTIMKIQPGKESMTEFWTQKRFSHYSLLRVVIHTGRTHQIRVHMLAYNHPVAGDQLYFNKKLNRKRDEQLGRLFLQASKLCFQDLGGEEVCFEAELAEKLADFIGKLK